MKKLLFLVTIFALLFLISCNEEAPVEQNSNIDASLSKKGGGSAAAEFQAIMETVNSNLASNGKNYRVAMAEFITNGEGNEVGNTVLSKVVGNKQLTADFVPFDPRREDWSGPINGNNDNITFAIDQTGGATPAFGGLTAAEADDAIARGMNTWDGLNTDLDLTRNSDGGFDLGYIAALRGIGGSFEVAADVQHAGFNFFLGTNVLGVTYTLIWVDDITGIPTDIDNNGKTDCAFREIYYSSAYPWTTDGSGIDLESVALHEAGHGLSQAHFGTVRIKNDGSLMASPRAVMNALYTGPYRDLAGTDKGGHSSNWGSWPKN